MINSLYLLFAIFVSAFFTAFFPINNFISEFFRHFTLYYLYASVGFFGIFLILRNGKFALLSLLVGTFIFVFLWEPSKQVRCEKSEFEDITVLQINVHRTHPNVPRLVEFAKKTDADVVILQEVSFKMMAYFKSLKEHYPYEAASREMAFFSKFPILNHKRFAFNRSRNAYTVTTIDTGKGIALACFEVHAAAFTVSRRHEEIKTVAKAAMRCDTPHKLIVGDLNTTPYSHYFREMISTSGMKPYVEYDNIAQKALSIFTSGTWPDIFPAVLRIPIDHLLVTDNIGIRHKSSHDTCGSDHMPVLSRLRLYHTARSGDQSP